MTDASVAGSPRRGLSEEWQARIQTSREMREAQASEATADSTGLADPGKGGKAVRLPTVDLEEE